MNCPECLKNDWLVITKQEKCYNKYTIKRTYIYHCKRCNIKWNLPVEVIIEGVIKK